MKKISIIGAGSVGGLCALRILEANLTEVVLVDIARDLALAKASDLEDAQYSLNRSYSITATDNFSDISGSEIIIITAGLARRPGMLREELLEKNALIVQDVARKVKKFAKEAICIVVTNPVDTMTGLFIRESGLKRERAFGMGINLDASRFANIISKRLNKDVLKIKPVVLGVHGEGMIPLSRLSLVEDRALTQIAPAREVREIEEETILRGAHIVELYTSGSAYFAPSAAILAIVKAILNDTNEIIGASVYLKGEYGLSDVCIGVPAQLGKKGIKEIIKLNLNKEELSKLKRGAEKVRSQIEIITKRKVASSK